MAHGLEISIKGAKASNVSQDRSQVAVAGKLAQGNAGNFSTMTLHRVLTSKPPFDVSFPRNHQFIGFAVFLLPFAD